MGHLGLTPQSIYKFGTYTVRAKEEEEALRLKKDAQMLADIGCFSIVFEKIPATLAGEVTAMVDCPTIGIGAGANCDGQVLVLHDMLGITQAFSPRFLRRYSDLGDQMFSAIRQYVSDVRAVDFPNESEQY
jgi:3-methyl-2-oxobutanoate hydroxymethyltransferase